jgi:hypothetical protein
MNLLTAQPIISFVSADVPAFLGPNVLLNTLLLTYVFVNQRQRIFLLASASRPALGSAQPPEGVLSPGVKRGRGVMLTIHPHLVPRLRMSRSYTSSHPCAYMTCSGTALLLTGNNTNHATICSVSSVQKRP